ncbi:transglycosylase SLT domain-containing protein [Pseudomonas matsuisoli]|nr:transglycosylase SLT domain-containing protein [Pseudomonas matsuisoli]
MLSALVGCQSTPQPDDSIPLGQTTKRIVQKDPRWLSDETLKNAEEEVLVPKDLWDRMRNGFALQDLTGSNPRIEQQRLWFVSKPSFLESASTNGGPYIHYIVERLEERKMPLELALLPVIESAYNPFAYSRAQAVGLWQFIPSTGRHFNLVQNSSYDGRRDIAASTDAAINYLTYLHEMFNGDWLLALAAYNAGEGTVSRAMERNQKLGLPTDYWNLPLPKETQDYVPKLLALSELVMSPDAYGIALDSIPDEPFFETVEVNRSMKLARVAALAGIDEDVLYQLNPAYKKKQTLDGPQQLLVPTDKAQMLAESLAQIAVPADTVEARVRPQARPITAGVQTASLTNVDVQLRKTVAPKDPVAYYRVRKGDTLYQIARRFKVELKALQKWNPTLKRTLQPGQILTVRRN